MTTLSKPCPLDNLVNLKVLVVGDAGVGKSSLMLSYTDDKFSADILPTVGLDFRVKVLEHKGFSVKMSIWDTAGMMNEEGLRLNYFDKSILIIRSGEVQKHQLSLLQRSSGCDPGV